MKGENGNGEERIGGATSRAAMSAIERTLASPWRTAVVAALAVLALSWISTDQQRRFAETRMLSSDTFRLNVWALFLPELAHFALWAVIAPTLLAFMLWSWNRLHPLLFAVAQLAACFGAAWSMGYLEFHVSREIVRNVTGSPIVRVDGRESEDVPFIEGDVELDGRDAAVAPSDELEGPPPGGPPPLGPDGAPRPRPGEAPPPDRQQRRFDRGGDRGGERGGRFDPRRFRGRPVDGADNASRQFGREVLLYLLALGVSGSAFAFLRQRKGERRAHELELETAALEGELARTQLRSLRAQLQPHFLFNALHGIGGLVREKRDGEALRTLSDLGGLLRRTLDADRVDRWSLDSEIALVEEYLSVESVRLGDRLATHVDVEDDVRGVQLPPLLLLPIVENSIRHGVATQARGGSVDVSCARIGDRLRIEVADTGPGFDAAVLRAGRHPADDEVHVGLQNTRERLERLFPGRHTFALSNRPGGGASVVIEIPSEA
ncbi:MAG: histidine kinase [Planctomycetota bacterium]